MSDTILPTPQSYAVQRAAPVQVNIPSAVGIARDGVRPSQVQFRNAGDNVAAGKEAISQANMSNLRAMAAISPVIAQRLQDKEEEEFQEGYLKHLQGTSVADIAKSQPFGGIFGDGMAVRGARMRQQENAGQALVQYVQQNQGDLSRMSLDEQRQVMGKFVSDLATGDPVADNLIAQGAMKTLPAMLDNMARMGEAENQRSAAISQADVMKQGADSLKYAKGQVATGQMAPEHYDALEAQFIDSSRPLPGQSQESYRAAITGNVLSLTRDGNFEMASLLRKSVLDSQMTPTESLAMDAQIKTVQSEWLKDNPVSRDYTDFSVQLPTQIAAGRYSTEDQVYADIDRTNRDYMIQTGSTTPLIDNEGRARAGALYAQEAIKLKDANDKLAQNMQDENVKRGLYSEGYAKGSPASMAAAGLDKATVHSLEQNEMNKFFTETTPGSSVVLGKLAINGHTNAPLKEYVTNTLKVLQGGGMPGTEDLLKLQRTYVKLVATPYGMGAASAYFGDDLELVQSMANLDMSDKRNQQMVRERSAAVRSKPSPDSEMVKTASDLVDSEVKPGFFSRTFGDGQGLGAGYEASIKDELKPALAQVLAQYPNMSQDNAMKTALAQVMKNKDRAGDMLITGSQPGAFLNALNSKLDVKIASPEDRRINTYINDAITAKVPGGGGFSVGSLYMAGDNVIASVIMDSGVEQNMILRIDSIATGVNQKKREGHDLQQRVIPAQREYNDYKLRD